MFCDQESDSILIRFSYRHLCFPLHLLPSTIGPQAYCRACKHIAVGTLIWWRPRYTTASPKNPDADEAFVTDPPEIAEAGKK